MDKDIDIQNSHSSDTNTIDNSDLHNEIDNLINSISGDESEPEVLFHFHTQTINGNVVGSYEIDADNLSSDLDDDDHDEYDQPSKTLPPNSHKNKRSADEMSTGR